MKKSKGAAKVGKVMREFKAGTLKSSSGGKVTKRAQAVAIAMSEAGMKKKATTKNKKPVGGKNPFFGNSLPFQLAEGKRWMKDSRPFGKMSTGKKKGK